MDVSCTCKHTSVHLNQTLINRLMLQDLPLPSNVKGRGEKKKKKMANKNGPEIEGFDFLVSFEKHAFFL